MATQNTVMAAGLILANFPMPQFSLVLPFLGPKVDPRFQVYQLNFLTLRCVDGIAEIRKL